MQVVQFSLDATFALWQLTVVLNGRQVSLTLTDAGSTSLSDVTDTGYTSWDFFLNKGLFLSLVLSIDDEIAEYGSVVMEINSSLNIQINTLGYGIQINLLKLNDLPKTTEHRVY